MAMPCKSSLPEDSHPSVTGIGLLPFVDPPEEGIAKIKEILAQVRFFYPHDSSGGVAALGASGCTDAMDLLLEMAKPDGSAVEQIGEEWIRAAAQLGGNRSNEVLLSFVDPDQKVFTKEFVPDYQHGNVLAGLLADRAEHDSEFKTELFRLASGELPPTKRMLLAKAFRVFGAKVTWWKASVCCATTVRSFLTNFSSRLKTHSWSIAHTGEKQMSTRLRHADRMRCENAFSRWRKRTQCGSVRHLPCSARSKCGGSSTDVPWMSRDTPRSSRVLVGRFNLWSAKIPSAFESQQLRERAREGFPFA
jgi:hypothetical protein